MLVLGLGLACLWDRHIPFPLYEQARLLGFGPFVLGLGEGWRLALQLRLQLGLGLGLGASSIVGRNHIGSMLAGRIRIRG